MTKRLERPIPKFKGKKDEDEIKDDLFELCIKKGLIEKTEYGYIFKPEFFETLEIYEED